MAEKSNFQGPFIAGLVLGMAAGAAGVYFWATERGQDFMEEMNELWDEARPELIKKGVISKDDETIGQAVKGFLLELAAEQAQAGKTEAKKRIRSNKMLFKGV